MSGRTGITVAGEVDMSNARLLEEYLNDLIQTDRNDLFLNLEQLSFIDSSGLAVLLNTRKLLQSFDRALVLVSPHELVRRVLEITGLDTVFEVGVAGETRVSAAQVPA